MGVSGNCPGYMLREELGREKMCVRQRNRAWGFEEKMRQGRGCSWTRICWMQVKEREVKRKNELARRYE